MINYQKKKIDIYNPFSPLSYKSTIKDFDKRKNIKNKERSYKPIYMGYHPIMLNRFGGKSMAVLLTEAIRCYKNNL